MKRGQFNFVWIFAILAGGVILFLAIYGAVKTGDSMRFASDSETAKSISILTDPLQAGFSEGSFGKISFQSRTRINNICFAGGLGKNDISVATRSGVGEEWNLAGGASSMHNKYIFSKERGEGLEYYVFSKPFDFPYKVNDLIFLASENYCFLNSPEKISEEVLGLGVKNVEVDNCSDNAEKVCFGGGEDCDVYVYGSCDSGCDSIYDYGKVVKSSGEVVYVGNLMYGAIFSDKGVYECNVERLLFRASKLARIFAQKADLMRARGCGSNLGGDLTIWGGMLENATSGDLLSLESMARSLGNRNNREICGLW
jgi:hypothetical protein